MIKQAAASFLPGIVDRVQTFAHDLNDAFRASDAPWNRWYLASLVILALSIQIGQTIVANDTDMWYHLSGGRYFWTQGEVPSTAFFSFIASDREWINYFWGFQALVYKVYSWGGYQGLIILRAILFTGSILAIALYVRAASKERAFIGALILAAAYLILMDSRGMQLRPHLVSYLMIPWFLYILEWRPRWAPLLPVLTILWVNLHGVEYVIGGLIGGAYFVEWLYQRSRKPRRNPEKGVLYPLSILGCGAALFVNPHGADILLTSFSPPPDLGLYVKEMAPIGWRTFISLKTTGLSVPFDTIFAGLFLLSGYALLRLAITGRLRFAHLMLGIGGLYLVFQGKRFMWEWSLLTLPLLCAWLGDLARQRTDNEKSPTISNSLLLLGVLAVPFASLLPRLDFSLDYPFHSQGLPVGTSAFLQHTEARGNLLMPPARAGYTHWASFPAVRVYSDMELPPFSDEDMFRILAAYRDAKVMRRLVSETEVDFLAVSLKSTATRKAMKELPEFVPVFFDDIQVLYAHRERQPGVAERYAIKAVDPYDLLSGEGTLEERLTELERIRKIYPSGDRVNHGLTRLLFDAKRFAEALPHARRFSELWPSDPNSHYLLGNILENQGDCDRAIAHYRKSYTVADSRFQPLLKRHIATCYYLLEDFEKAYRLFSKTMNPYQRLEDVENLYQYAFSSVVMGDLARGRQLIDMLLFQASEMENEEVVKQASGLLDKLDSGELRDQGVYSWLTGLFSS